jgi:hypothetical protein
MARIEFKAKVQTVYNMDHSVAYRYVQVPAFDRKHCDMCAFRTHPKYGGLANSDLFQGILRRIRDERFPWSVNGAKAFKTDAVPDGVTLDESGFLATVTLNV